MDNIVSRLFQVPTFLKDENSDEVIQMSSMVAQRGRGGCHSN